MQQDPGHVYACVNLGWSLYHLKDYLLAEEAYRKALELDADNPDARVNLVLLYLQTNHREKARAELTEGLKAMPNDPRLLRLRQKLAGAPGSQG